MFIPSGGRFLPLLPLTLVLPCPPLSYPIVVELLSVVILLSPSLTEAVKQRVFG